VGNAKDLGCRVGGTNGCLKRKDLKKNQKHEPNIVEITHMCIMHGVHTSLNSGPMIKVKALVVQLILVH
jgi:hypothetical protein